MIENSSLFTLRSSLSSSILKGLSPFPFKQGVEHALRVNEMVRIFLHISPVELQ